MAQKYNPHFTFPGEAVTMAQFKAMATDVRVHADAFYRNSFRQQGFTDKIFIPWKKRKGGKKTRSFGDGGKIDGKAILVRTGNLRRGYYSEQVDHGYSFEIQFKNLSKYAEVHNDGFKGTAQVSEHSRRLFTKVKTKLVTKAGKTRNKTDKVQKAVVKVRAHSRNMNIPRRRVAGPSAVLGKQIELIMSKTADKLLDKK